MQKNRAEIERGGGDNRSAEARKGNLPEQPSQVAVDRNATFAKHAICCFLHGLTLWAEGCQVDHLSCMGRYKDCAALPLIMAHKTFEQ